MTTKQSNPEADGQFLERLKKHPKLRERFESLLSIVEADDIRLADDAEDKVTEGLHETGRELLQEWATEQADKSTEEFYQRRKDVKKGGKKNCIGTQPMEGFRPKNRC